MDLINTLKESINSTPLPLNIDEQFEAIKFEDYDVNIQSTLHYLKAKLLQKKDPRNPKIEEELNASISKNIDNHESLELLGEYYYENGNYKESCSCFQRIINAINDKCIEKRILRKLSISTRHQGTNAEEKIKYVSESLELAKRSLNIDLKDGDSWYVYGNSLLSSFFWADQKTTKLLNQTLTAYRQAEINLISDENKPDLYFNRSVVLKFLQQYQKSIEGFNEALKHYPDWKEAKEYIDEIVSSCSEIFNFIKGNKDIKPSKEIDVLVTSLRKEIKLIKTTKSSATVSELSNGLNKMKFLVCKAIKYIGNTSSLPQLFICIDNERQFFVVSFYNVPRNFIKYGTSITLVDPILTTIHIDNNGINIQFPSVSVQSLKDVYFNGNLLDQNLLLKPELTISSS